MKAARCILNDHVQRHFENCMPVHFCAFGYAVREGVQRVLGFAGNVNDMALPAWLINLQLYVFHE